MLLSHQVVTLSGYVRCLKKEKDRTLILSADNLRLRTHRDFRHSHKPHSPDCGALLHSLEHPLYRCTALW